MAASRRALLPLAAAAYAAALILASPPCPDGDALGFLKKAADPNAVSEGHLLFVPLLRLLGALAGANAPADFWLPGRIAGALGVVAAGILTANATRRLGGSERASLAAGALFLSCAGIFTAGSCLESYGVTIFAIALAVDLALRAREGGTAALVGSALATGAAAGLHLGVAPVMLLPVLAPLTSRPFAGARAFARAALAGAAACAAFLAPIAVLAAKRSMSASETAAFLRSANHNLPGFDGVIAFATAPFGAARAFFACPFPWEDERAFWIRLWPALFALVAFVWCLTRGARRAGAGGALLLAGAAAPLAVVGVSYYASDPERWIVALPALVPIAALGARPRTIAIGAALLFAAHLATSAVPAALERTDYDTARAMSAGLAANELVVSPGHGADELVGFFERVEPERFLLAYEGASRGLRGSDLLAAMEAKIDVSRRAGREVRVVRILDPADFGDIRGWKELERYFDVDRWTLRARLESMGFREDAMHPRFASATKR